MNHTHTIALYQPVLHSIAYNLLRCKADAEDIVQDTFLKYLSIDQTKIQNTKAYLITAVTNNCLNHLKSLRKKKEEYLDSFHLPEIFVRLKEFSVSHIDLDAELSAAFHVLQSKLEPLERAVYLLKEVFDLDYEALQVILDKKKDHCRQLFCRAKKKLSEETDKISIEIPTKAELINSFKKACGDYSTVTEFVSELRKDISSVIEKKF
ncbi:MAG: sigma-70 family RNA polymerase sigma factor [Cyclobacteriaceae bacterium]|nr:sigma-70 family RNA polymerase sigma factor [Cyclobacteriaceae bacterium]